MKKLILFDLDGVLVDTVDLHFVALNTALLHEGYFINADNRIKFDGLTSKEKMELLGVPQYRRDQIQRIKDIQYLKLINNIQKNNTVLDLLNTLKQKYVLGLCTNSNKSAAYTVIDRACIKDFFEIILTSDDVKNRKPDSEIYELAMKKMKYAPKNTIIIEDSPQGITAAQNTGAKVVYATYENIDKLKL